MKEEKISAQSVTQAMQRMIKKKIVRVTDHLLVVSVYTRVFVPTCSREAFTVAEIERLHKSLWGGKKSTTNMLALTLMDFMKENSKSDISLEDMKDLRQTIDQYIKKQDKE